ncbi:PnuC protein [Bermanella sp. R86510]|uniref:PnuC protein n=1 Tax=unclassified Bermanella TaxID=2627862 RepID=UPI0037CC0515
MGYFQYFGIDWLAMVLTFFAIWQIGNRNKFGFILMIMGNLCWIALGYMTDSLAMMVANATFIAMNVRAIVKWVHS